MLAYNAEQITIAPSGDRIDAATGANQNRLRRSAYGSTPVRGWQLTYQTGRGGHDEHFVPRHHFRFSLNWRFIAMAWR